MKKEQDLVKCLGRWCSLRNFCRRYDEKAENPIICCDEEERNGFISMST